MDILVNRSNSVAVCANPVDQHIGRLLLDAGKLTEQDIKDIVALQKTESLRFGEAARKLGLAEEADILRALSVQFEYPSVPVGGSSLKEALFSAYQPQDVRAEAMRMLRSQLMLRWFGGRRKLLAVVGADAGEGCSEVAANLAISFAQLGEKTLLIDANMRNPSQEKLFGLRAGSGLSNLLAGRGTLASAVSPIEDFHNLSVLCAGSLPPNPQELLSRPGFQALLSAAKEEYDIVILDTPPAVISADAQIVAALASGCVLVTCRHQTRIADVVKIKDEFTSIGVTMLGAIIEG
jgi:protein-tyrosine kinase